MFCKIVIISCLIALACSADCDSTKCPAPPKHYVELGCKPITNDKECCPSRFECPSPSDFDDKKCYFNNKVYEERDQIPGNETESLCSASCFCSANESPYNIVCAQIECADLFNSNLRKCAKKIKRDACCAEKYICEEEEIKKLSKCYFEGIEYLEGASIYPKGTCMKCHCDEHFKNDTIIGNPNCDVIDCGTSLRYLNQFRSGCIPTYFRDASCCSYQWRCPDAANDKIETEARDVGLASNDPNMSCKFGDLKMNLGDVLKSDDKCVECKCVVPPMPYCIQKENC